MNYSRAALKGASFPSPTVSSSPSKPTSSANPVDVQCERSFKERALQAWSPDDEPSEPPSMVAGLGHSSHGWDQFRVNEERFGVKTTFDEDLYTTALDRSSSFYKERIEDADRLSRAIMEEATSNVHLAEERGHVQQEDAGGDEEDKYGSVLRAGYIPPTFRRRPKNAPKPSETARDEDGALESRKLKPCQEDRGARAEDREARAEEPKLAAGAADEEPAGHAVNGSRTAVSSSAAPDTKAASFRGSDGKLSLDAPEFIPNRPKAHYACASGAAPAPPLYPAPASYQPSVPVYYYPGPPSYFGQYPAPYTPGSYHYPPRQAVFYPVPGYAYHMLPGDPSEQTRHEQRISK